MPQRGQMRGLEPSSRGGKTSGASSSLNASSTSVTRSSLIPSTAPEEIPPEVPQHVLPVELSVGNLVELLLKIGGEIVFDIMLEEAFQEGDDQPALGLRNELALVDRHVFAVAQRLQRRRVGRRPADAELFHFLDEVWLPNSAAAARSNAAVH